jgi:hypothetical protein
VADNKRPATGRGILRATLRDWLNTGSWTLDYLYALLQGDNWPPIIREEQPYELFMAGTCDDPSLRIELAKRLAVALDDEPEVKLPGTRPAQMLASLLTLCSEVYNPDVLWEPLLRMNGRHKLTAEWPRGVPLNDLLRAALILNQRDDSMMPEWTSMIEGTPGDFLAGNMYDGIRGFYLRKPDNGTTPRWALLGPALRKVALRLSGSGDRRNIEFREILDPLRKLYQLENWDELFLLAVHYNWPRWTITSFVPPLATTNDDVYAMSSLGVALKECGGKKREELWGGLIWKVSIKGNKEAGALFQDFSHESLEAANEMKRTTVTTWLAAMGNALIYTCSDSKNGLRKAALDSASRQYHMVDRLTIHRTT